MTVLDSCGEKVVKSFTHSDLVEPIDVAVNSKGEFVVADSGARKVFKFDPSGKLITSFGSSGTNEGQFKVMSALCVGKNDEILVADHRIQVFSRDGKFLRKVSDSEGGGTYGGLVVDSGGYVLASKTEKAVKGGDRNSGVFEKGATGGSPQGGRSLVHVFHPYGKLQYSIDSNIDRLKRPAGVALLPDGRVAVADLGNHAVKMFYYK